MLLPKIQNHDGGLQIVDVFRGLNRAEKIEEGEWSDERNLTSDRFPMLSVRAKRNLLWELDGYISSMLAKDKIYALLVTTESLIVDAPDMRIATLIRIDDGYPTALKDWSFDSSEVYPKQMVSFGAYIVIPGLNKWYNTASLEATYGDIDAVFELGTPPWTFTVFPVDEDGNKLTINERLSADEGAEQEAEDPQTYQDGECYAIPSSKVIRQYKDGYWRTVKAALRIEGTGINAGFEKGDVAEFTDWSADPVTEFGKFLKGLDLNGYQTIADAGTGYIVLKDKFFSYTTGTGTFTTSNLDLRIPTVARRMPDMDFVIECNNRLWGCKYGGGINELYASELGSFKNWRVYDGTSMASWAASVGTDGPWTGAIAFNGYPIFFKENCAHRVYISAAGAHQVVDQTIRGVQEGCHNSLCALNGMLYYMSRDGVTAWNLKKSAVISEELGDLNVEYAFFGANQDKLWCLIDEKHGENMVPMLYVYDTKRGLWHIESSADPYGIDAGAAFLTLGDSFYVCNAALGMFTPSSQTTTAKMWDFNGKLGTPEDDVVYTCTSGLIGWQNNEQKYVSRFDMRLTLPAGATMKVEIEYDSDGEWHEQGTATGGGTGSIMIPVRPRRCDHFRIRLSGKGEMRMYSWAKRLEKGSDRV